MKRRKYCTYEFVSIDHHANDPPFSLNRYHGPIRSKTYIKGSYDLREHEPSDHSMSRTYRDHRIRYLQIHTK